MAERDGIAIDLDINAALAEFKRVGSVLSVAQILGLIGDRYLAWIDENFRREGIESPWAPLRPNTVAARRKGSKKILQDTSTLKKSANKKVVADLLRVGFASKVAEWHHFGTDPVDFGPKTKKALRFITTDGVTFAKFVRHPGLPARPLLPSKSVAGKIASDVVEASIRKATRRAR